MTNAPPADREWRPWMDGYLVSDRGDFYSTKSDGRLLRPSMRHPGGYVQYIPFVNGRKVCVYAHTLVLELFVSPRPDGCYGLHIDGDPTNNTVGNLMWGTPSLNNHHGVAHGRHLYANKTECPSGHPYDEANTYTAPRGDGTTFRQCRECVRANGRAYRARQRAKSVAS